MLNGKIIIVPSSDVFRYLYPNREGENQSRVFTENLVNWFTSGVSSRFLILANVDNDVHRRLVRYLEHLGHSVVIQLHGEPSLEDMQQYQGLFLFGLPQQDKHRLITYVESGGCLCIAGGIYLDSDYDYPPNHDCSHYWNPLLEHYGLQFDTDWMPSGTHGRFISVNIDHPVFHGVNRLPPGLFATAIRKTDEHSNNTHTFNQMYFAIVAQKDKSLPANSGLRLVGSLQNVGIATDGDGRIKLQVFNGSSFSASNVKGHLTFHGPCPLGESPETLYGAPISDLLSITFEDDTGILDNTLTFEKQDSSNTKVIPANAWSDEITVKIHASHNVTDIGSQNLDNADYLLKMALESEIEVNVEEEQIVHFRVYPQ